MSKMIPTEIREHVEKWSARSKVEIVLFDKEALVLRHPMGHLNGYCWIDKSRVPKLFYEYSNILYDLDVHGGITYSKVIGNWVIYGFDTAHYNDDENPLLRDPEEIKGMAVHMKKEIMRAVALWIVETRSELERVSEGGKD